MHFHVHELGFGDLFKTYVFRGSKEISKENILDQLGLTGLDLDFLRKRQLVGCRAEVFEWCCYQCNQLILVCSVRRQHRLNFVCTYHPGCFCFWSLMEFIWIGFHLIHFRKLQFVFLKVNMFSYRYIKRYIQIVYFQPAREIKKFY